MYAHIFATSIQTGVFPFFPLIWEREGPIARGTWEGEGTQVPVKRARHPLIFPAQVRATGPFFSQGRREEGKSRPRKMCDSLSPCKWGRKASIYELWY